MNNMRHLLVPLLVLLLSACKIVIQVPSNGSVQSLSGTYSCGANSRCEIDVSDTHFNETFEAIPDPGYVFAGWVKIDGGICGGLVKPCGPLDTTPYAGNSDVLALLASDDEYILQPVFEPLPVGVIAPAGDGVGHPMFLSPHVNPIVSSGYFVYATNTPSDTVEVIDPTTREVVASINVGIDPVALAVRPDGTELWVSNHVSDSISVVDIDPHSPTLHQVIATVQAFENGGLVTDFDEPTGIAFAGKDKAYVALGPDNEIVAIDARNYSVQGRLPVQAQDPRAIAVRGDRLFVVPFESNNQTQISGCLPHKIDGDVCTFDMLTHVVLSNNILSLGYDADIVVNPALPDRDLFVFDTRTDSLQQTVTGVGTLLYGLAVDSKGSVFVTQTDARNDVNGRAGTQKHGLPEMGNRAFLNQVTRIDCAPDCAAPLRFDLEPLPPQHPAPGEALATPFAIAITRDDSLIVATAASSNRLFTMNPDSGEVLGRIDVGAVPRGIALRDGPGATLHGWVLNVADNTVDLVDLTDATAPVLLASIVLADPTPALVKAGRKAFNNAAASTSETFSCESCHPDGHTDQLLWILDTPICDVPGCTQIPPRLTMPVRGLQDTAPYHWDGIPGDPYGGRNTASINTPVEPNCDLAIPESCTRVLVDGGMGSTMCDQSDCPVNNEGKPGALDAAERDAMAHFLLKIPYPPSQRRPIDNVIDEDGRDGFFEFSFEHTNTAGSRSTGGRTCGNCHKNPFLVSTNTAGTGMDPPTWRGAYDRWMILPQGRANTADLFSLVGIDDSLPEKDIWTLGGSTDGIWEMVLQGSTGFHGAFGRQITLNSRTVDAAQTAILLGALEQAATEDAIELQGEGVWLEGATQRGIGLDYAGGEYRDRSEQIAPMSRTQLLDAAANGQLVVTFTARMGDGGQADTPQPGIWLTSPFEVQTQNVELPQLAQGGSLSFQGRHIQAGAAILLDGVRVPGEVSCVTGVLPNCEGELLHVQFDRELESGGLYFLQLQNPRGRISNDMMFVSELALWPPREGNLINGDGTFNTFSLDWSTITTAANSIDVLDGVLLVDMRTASANVTHAQLSHPVMVVQGREYSLCFDGRATGAREMSAFVDSNRRDYINLGGHLVAALTPDFQTFRLTFEATQTDLQARVAFNFAQSDLDVELDNVGLYEGGECGVP
ncbi:MAG: hypothetical protein Hals2KO_39200 [Halioglobus sp.]